MLFLCTFDPFGRGYDKYSFQNLCKEDRELYLKDGTEKIFDNCAADPEKVPENLRELYDYTRNTHMKQGRQHKLISTIFLATSVTKKLDHNN